MPTITFVKPYRSIVSMGAVNLTQLSFITGNNGVGKTHLLRAIKNGSIALEGVEANSVAYYSISDVKAGTAQPFDSSELLTIWTRHKKAINEAMRGMREHFESQMLSFANRNIGLPKISSDRIMSMTKEGLLALGVSADQADVWLKTRTDIEQASDTLAISQLSKTTLNSSTGERTVGLYETVKNTAHVLGKSIFELDQADLDRPFWGKPQLFGHHALAQLFTSYRDAQLRNWMRQKASEAGEAAEALTETDFERRYGRPPWKVFNELMEDRKLGFSLDGPELYSDAPYSPVLRKLSTGAEVDFSELSSGETILMSVALSMYVLGPRQQRVEMPRAILFDEVDAPLHPSMCRDFLRTVEKFLVHERDVIVVIATHSPSTIAMAPPNSVFEMSANPPRLEHVSVGRALNGLTAGVPTIAIDFEGRRQVFCEADTDARIYSALYEVLKPILETDRSLQFVGTGTKDGVTSTDVNTGKAIVTKLVQELADAGNKSVFGLIDWDGGNVGNERLFALSPHERDGLENAVLDPLLVAGALLKLDRAYAAEALGVPRDTSYLEFLSFSPTQLQQVIDAVQEKVVDTTKSTKSISIPYLSGISLMVSESYLHMDDHLLEERVRAAFPRLNRVGRNAGTLPLYVVDNVARDAPALIAVSVMVTFKKILEARVY